MEFAPPQAFGQQLLLTLKKDKTMISNPNAQNPASRPAIIPNQGTGPFTPPEQSINRKSVEQGNTSTEKSLNKPLAEWAQVSLVQQAMNRQHNCNFEQWAAHVFGTALSPHTEDGYNLITYSRFFRDLLLFISKPKVSAKFYESVPYGHEMIQTLSELFLELQGLSHYEEYALYHGLTHMKFNDIPEFLHHAKEYLSGEDLRRVMEANGKEVITAKDSVEEDIRLIEALDRHFPGVQWPTYAYHIVHDPRMKAHLEILEEERIEKETSPPREETPEERATKEIRKVIDYQIDFGYYHRKEEAKETASKKATGAISGRGGAVTKRKPVSLPTKKPALARKPSTNKKA